MKPVSARLGELPTRRYRNIPMKVICRTNRRIEPDRKLESQIVQILQLNLRSAAVICNRAKERNRPAIG